MTFNNTNNPKYNRTCVFKCRYMCYLQINKMLSLREYDLAQRIRIMKCFSRLSPVFLCGAGTGTILFNWYFGATLVLALIVPENGFVRSQLQAIIWWIWLFWFFFMLNSVSDWYSYLQMVTDLVWRSLELTHWGLVMYMYICICIIKQGRHWFR